MGAAVSERLFLTHGQHGEVADLTGAHTKAGQIRNLRQNGIRHTVNQAGWPIVAVATVEGTATKQQDTASWRPAVLEKAA